MSQLNTRLREDYYINKQNQAYRDFKGEDGKPGHGDRNKRWDDEGAVRAEFKADLEAEYGIDKAIEAGTLTRKRADTLFRIAWDYGHSAGYREVDIHYGELSELVL